MGTVEDLSQGVQDAIKKAEAFDLRLFVPTFAPFPEEVVVLSLAKRQDWPKVEETTFTDPRVIDLYFEGYAGSFPLLEFDSFVKGVATAALLVEPEKKEHIRKALEALVQAMLEFGGDMPSRPALPEHLSQDCLECVAEVINKSETFNWRRMLSFVYGCFWLLGFSIPAKPNKTERAALAHIKEVCLRCARLSCLPV